MKGRPNMLQLERLPGATWAAAKIDRRSALRRTANVIFYGAVATASGAVSIGTFLADPAGATGGCCPTSCCGPSPCCGSSCCGYNCCTGSGQCNGSGSNCGWDTRDWGASCWSCGEQHGWRCCDCQTPTQCTGAVTNRCICTLNF